LCLENFRLRPVHFEIHAADPQLHRRTELFGWTFTKWESPMVTVYQDGREGTPGIDGG
jgi:predicted enzyme related to lactoylglutathione lyase